MRTIPISRDNEQKPGTVKPVRIDGVLIPGMSDRKELQSHDGGTENLRFHWPAWCCFDRCPLGSSSKGGLGMPLVIAVIFF
jgi:hypothetical protein